MAGGFDYFLLQLRYVLKKIKLRPLGYIISAVSIALALAVVDSIFHIYHQAVMSDLPIRNPELIYRLTLDGPSNTQWGLSFRSLDEIKSLHLIESVTISQNKYFLLNDSSEVVEGSLVDFEYFKTMGVDFYSGYFATSNHQPGLVVSKPLWKKLKIGSNFNNTIKLNDVSIPITGVLGSSVRNLPGSEKSSIWLNPAAYLLIDPSATIFDNKGLSFFNTFIKIKRNSKQQDVIKLLDVVLDKWMSVEPEMQTSGASDKLKLSIKSIHNTRVGKFNNALPVYVFFTASTLLLLSLSLLSYTSLNISKLLADERSFAMQRALGIRFGHRVIQALAESICIGIPSATLGAILGAIFVSHITMFLPLEFISISIDATPNLYTFIMSITVAVIGCFMSLLVAYAFTTKRSMLGGIKSTGTSIFGKGPQRILLVFQISLSLLLINGTGITLTGLLNAWSMKLGYRPDGVMAYTYLLPKNDSEETIIAKHRAILNNIRIAYPAMMVSAGHRTPMCPPYATTKLNKYGKVSCEMIAPGWYKTLGGKLVCGNDFSDQDCNSSIVSKILVNEAFCKNKLNSTNPIGMTIDGYEVIGVIGDMRINGPDAPPRPTIYYPIQFNKTEWQSIMIRYGKYLPPTKNSIASLVHQVQPGVVIGTEKLEERLAAKLNPRRLAAWLLGASSVIAMSILAMGIFSLQKQMITSRTKEIGIRLSLGASRTQILLFSMSWSAPLTVIGIIGGCALSVITFTILKDVFVEIGSFDPYVLILAIVLIVVVTVLASIYPSIKISTVNPSDAIRE